jgi:hypothetical protein
MRQKSVDVVKKPLWVPGAGRARSTVPSMARSHHDTLASAGPCEDHPACIRFYRPDGAINEAGWWHAQLRQPWHLRGPDPSDAGFPTLGGPVDTTVAVDVDDDPLDVLLPYVGRAAVMAANDVPVPAK